MEVAIASSSVDAGISCWDLKTGAELLRHKSCASPPHGLTCIGNRFLAASQLRDSSANSGSIFYWSRDKPQVAVKSFPAEPIVPLIANRQGTYIIGGGESGEIYFWEVATGKLLKKWHAHLRGVTCMVYSDDESLLVSGSKDGTVKVWSLFMVFDDMSLKDTAHPYVHSFTDHALPVTDVVCGSGGTNAIILSASEDRTCKVWSLSKGILLRSILFPSVIKAIALDPMEHVFYAGSIDGKVYIAALTAESNSSNIHGMHIIRDLPEHSKPVTCLACSSDGSFLVSGLEDGMIRVWDIKSGNIVRMFRHAKGPVNNIVIVRKQCDLMSTNAQGSSRRHGSLPSLQKFAIPKDDEEDLHTVVHLHGDEFPDRSLFSSDDLIEEQIKELKLKQQGSSVASDMESVQKWKQMYDNLYQLFVECMLDGDQQNGELQS